MKNQDTRLLAKSPKGERTVDLVEHSRDVYRAAAAMYGRPTGELTRLGGAWLRAFKVHADDRDTFLRTLAAAAWLHDLGKANSEFQKAVRRQGEQAVRHEHVSALLLWLPVFQEWLRTLPGVNTEAVMAAVLSHHVKASHENLGASRHGDAFTLRVALGSPEVRVLLDEVRTCLGAATAPQLEDLVWPGAQLAERAQVERFRRTAHDYRRKLRRDDRGRALNAAVKGALIAADGLGSAMTRAGMVMEEWLAQCFGRPLLTEQWLDEHILGPRQREVAERNGRVFAWLDFQEAAGALGSRALLMSACGSGKTLAAWNWVRSQLARRPAARVIFLYPTRATATEGFRDYVSHAGGEHAALVHGTAAYDLETLFENPHDPRSEEPYVTEQRLFALGHWDRVAFSATVDQFLGFLACQYGSVCLLPLLVDSVVVIDEVHAFDRKLFGHLESFLRWFDIPALCMTATLTRDRLRILEERELERFPSDVDGEQFQELEKRAAAPRYRFVMGEKEQALALARESWERGRRVLWVVNTVSRCQEAVALLQDTGMEEVKCYHSRFRLRDRRERHRDAIKAFRQPERCILVATQVCEMSLDLDADVLITETAPVSALIQRAGRCWRREAGNGLGTVFVYEAEGSKPYGVEELQMGRAFVEEMIGHGAISQSDMAAYLAKQAAVNPQAEAELANAPFLGGGMYACAADESLREESEFTVDAVLDGDIDEYMSLRRRGDEASRGFICPVPRKEAFADPKGRLDRPRHTADSSRYDPLTGYRGGSPERSRDGKSSASDL